MSHFRIRSIVGARVRLHVGTAVLAFGLSACALDRSGETNADGAVASSSASGDAEAPTSGATAPGSSGMQSVSADASAGTGGTTDVGGGAGSESGSSGGNGGNGGDGGGTASSSETSASVASSGSGGSAPVCGDDETEGAEECDDANETAGDGCGPTCLIEKPDDCPGTPIPLGPGQLVINGSTAGANDTFQESQNVGFCDDGNFSGPDLVYAVTPSVSGVLRAELVAEYDAHSLVIRTTCGNADDDFLHCDYGEDPEEIDRVDAPVQQDSTYFVIVDSYDDEAGDFTLTLTLTAQ